MLYFTLNVQHLQIHSESISFYSKQLIHRCGNTFCKSSENIMKRFQETHFTRNSGNDKENEGLRRVKIINISFSVIFSKKINFLALFMKICDFHDFSIFTDFYTFHVKSSKITLFTPPRAPCRQVLYRQLFIDTFGVPFTFFSDFH